MKVIFVQPDGSEQIVEAEPGSSVMEAAVFEMIDGIIGMCGGICSCATCHCFVEEPWRALLPPPGPGETEMMNALDDVGPGSRLGCQIILTEHLDGIRLKVPKEQL
ncbi:2Fe-2S iron-sulfur cluster-binding protein [Sphingosinicella soli]|uniref:2Fe-2S ferredoxin n=1 Tax=Sphingosinicella soli TaxID=333708 RepID=A0A7W7B4B7_9SPHN|nr:2Fe-2S iron-sulfur cluster-binding protein [Sphingosinicella soli]MBB4632672.1 2Fe-2S ferredoxin [Sphingosinicella soli]